MTPDALSSINTNEQNKPDDSDSSSSSPFLSNVVVEYVSADVTAGLDEENAQKFHAIMSKFGTVEELFAVSLLRCQCAFLFCVSTKREAKLHAEEHHRHTMALMSSICHPLKQPSTPEESSSPSSLDSKATTQNTDDKDGDDADANNKHDDASSTAMSKKRRKMLCRYSIASLKASTPRPDVIEAHDVTSTDPLLLVHLKSSRNTVAVPKHWSQKRKYLQGRTTEKPAYQLPSFIADTGIAKIRDALLQLDEAKKAKQKMRERTQPRMHKVDIDYQVS